MVFHNGSKLLVVLQSIEFFLDYREIVLEADMLKSLLVIEFVLRFKLVSQIMVLSSEVRNHNGFELQIMEVLGTAFTLNC